ncbi:MULTISPECIES: hypothetical protein [unclassified Streptomyces]|uniref:hypothetical protein n=1 Tax=unclassified Streptomyces TaxID=2593676 RepID=UPI000C2733CC|nr:hypothetical protein [Streptomyces sp. CB02959]PJN38070.1 hypothetical protein CG747_24575 [Streptomyces sp. CB02959]
MSNPAKRKGTAWEREVRHYLNTALGQYVDHWKDAAYPWKDPHDPDNVIRPAQTGARDVGDLHARPFVLECKAERSIRLADYVRQAKREATHAGFPLGVAIVKAPRRSAADGYAVMDLATFAQVLVLLRRSEAGDNNERLDRLVLGTDGLMG